MDGGSLLVSIVLCPGWCLSHPPAREVVGGHPLSPRSGAAPLTTPPLIARRRYARGEITREEFERIRQDLMRGTR
ncbi:MAG TPA: SHOCT domain-containing protein [Dehalococcoidia bacterium]|nr:SHOCT domain-containing protein [Dehalococcoidia bacterium]